MNSTDLPMFEAATPAIRIRGVHLDLKGLPPPFPRLLQWVELVAALKFNLILVEWEDTFPWKFDTRLRGETVYSEEEIARFAEACRKHKIEIVPLVQSLGHAENVLAKAGYESLREVAHRTDVFHPLHPGSADLIATMLEEVLELLPETRRFHLGCDEADTLGQHPASRACIETHGVAALYRQHLAPLIDYLEARQIRPLLWHDGMVHWPMEELVQLGRRVDLVVWGYTGDPADPATYHHRLPHAQQLQAAGCRLWAATAFKGASGANSDRPDTDRLQTATLGWIALAPRFCWEGVIATGWSRYASGRIQTEPFDAALDSLVNTAAILHDGAAPGLARCEAWLDAHGEGDLFRQRKAALERLTLHTRKAWDFLRHLEEQLALLAVEPGRAHSGIEEVLLDILATQLADQEKAAAEVEMLLEASVAKPWMAQYNRVRIAPIRAALERLRLSLTSFSKPGTSKAPAIAIQG